MDTQQISAPSRAPSSGVVHINIRLTDGYTIISNRLSQHRGMSLLAIGLGTHIQSLPVGRRIGIKALAAIFPESEAAIAAGLRELECHGFLRRTRERVQGGRVATRTESYNHPEAAARRAVAIGSGGGAAPAPVREPKTAPVPAPELVRVREPMLAPAPEPALEPVPEPALAPVPEPALAPVPRGVPAPVPEREPVPVRKAITEEAPLPLRYPPNFVRHRLTELLPPLPPVAAPVVPLQNCEECDRAFRSSVPGVCRGCGEARTAGGEPFSMSA
ncbi:hypothetical protein [Streptomyces cyaneofuscatus]|uniref:hypothetical protein n=1 Tax=Streptomyces cyaneofuscatus TaxID=66883 RepID=UPI0037A9817B